MAGGIVEAIADLYERRGGERYSEVASQAEHALQAAASAEREGAPAPLIAAALLHDIGHLLHKLPPDHLERGTDDRHEASGAKWLARHFPPAVSEPIRLHVAAKRFLCATEPGYWDGLSAASKRSLELQGGAFTHDEAQDFIACPFAGAAVRLRRWDEHAKIRGAETPGWNYYRPVLEASLAA